MAKYKVVIVDDRYDSYDEEYAVLARADTDVVIEKSAKEQDVINSTNDADGVIVNLAPITEKIVSAMRKCKCISRYGVGYDNVETHALKKRGIHLANVPDYCAEDVSDHAFALFMDCVRKVSRKDRLVRQGQWNLSDIQDVFRISGKIFGFVGFGLIAKCFHRKLSGFNLSRVLISDPFISIDAVSQAGAELVELDTLCREADYISVHAPLVPSTEGLIGQAQFDLMKKTAIIINTSRGPLIDENSLINALENKKIACAGLDVFETEPLPPDSKLKNLDNVTITDHAGWYSQESMKELKTKAAQNIADVLDGKKPRYIVKL